MITFLVPHVGFLSHNNSTSPGFQISNFYAFQISAIHDIFHAILH